MKIFYSIKRRIKRFFYSILNIAKWSKVLWNEQDWDYGFLLDIIQYKLKKMEKYFSTADICTSETYDEILDSLRICIKSLEKIINEDSFNEFHNNLPDHTYGKEYTEVERKLFTEAVDNYTKKEKELNDEFFDTMKENFRKWWD